MKVQTGCGSQYAYDAWAHISNLNYHAGENFTCYTPLEVFPGKTLKLLIFRHDLIVLHG